VIKTDQDLSGTEEGREGGREWGEMTQTMYAHVNKRTIIIKKKEGCQAESQEESAMFCFVTI
jgi:hypothetical protein